jgi:hypothetical protein
MPISRKKKGPRKIVGPTHNLTYSKEGGFAQKTQAYGKDELFSMIRAMMRDGYTEFHITTINPYA